MSPERPEMRLVREKLESVLAPQLASSVLFEALSEVGGMPPATGEATLALVEGPLARVLRRRVRSGDGDVVITDLSEMLRQIVGPAMTPVMPITRARAREMDATLEIQLGSGAVPVYVIGGKPELALRLGATLGPGRIVARTLGSCLELQRHLDSALTPPIVLIDAVEFPAIEPRELAIALAGSPPGTVHAIWGVDLAYGGVVLGELVERHVPATPLDRREGIEPLLDLVRSRRA